MIETDRQISPKYPDTKKAVKMITTPTIKYSKQRELIFNRVKNFPTHPTADEVYTALKKDNPALSLGTVYRNLNLLAKRGELIKIHIDNSKERFDARTEAHCHLLCTECGKVYDIDDSAPGEIEQRILERYGHIVTEVSLNFKGICRSCAKRNASE